MSIWYICIYVYMLHRPPVFRLGEDQSKVLHWHQGSLVQGMPPRSSTEQRGDMGRYSSVYMGYKQLQPTTVWFWPSKYDIYIYYKDILTILGFPRIGVPLFIIHFDGIFHYKSSSYWGYPHLWNPQYAVWVWPSSAAHAIASSLFSNSSSMVSAGRSSSRAGPMQASKKMEGCAGWRGFGRFLFISIIELSISENRWGYNCCGGLPTFWSVSGLKAQV